MWVHLLIIIECQLLLVIFYIHLLGRNLGFVFVFHLFICFLDVCSISLNHCVLIVKAFVEELILVIED